MVIEDEACREKTSHGIRGDEQLRVDKQPQLDEGNSAHNEQCHKVVQVGQIGPWSCLFELDEVT